jgi:hypothetical protein
MENSITHTAEAKTRRRGRYEDDDQRKESEERKKRKSEEFNELLGFAVYVCSLLIAYLP